MVHQYQPVLQELLSKHEEVFKDELCTLKDVQAKFEVNTTNSPRFAKARPVPYAIRNKVDDELERLEKHGSMS